MQNSSEQKAPLGPAVQPHQVQTMQAQASQPAAAVVQRDPAEYFSELRIDTIRAIVISICILISMTLFSIGLQILLESTDEAQISQVRQS